MDDPAIGGRVPKIEALEAGEYWWCACGLSKNQPFCDGSHKGSKFQPLKLEMAEPKRVALCACKRTQNPPYCDGGHARLPAEG